MDCLNQEQLQNDLKVKKICRFCLCQTYVKLSSIYMRDTRIKTSAPLPIQIMAIASIEVFTNDGMPSYICNNCTQYFEFSYQFKQMCKKADTLLRQYPLTGKWPNELEKPKLKICEIEYTPNRLPKTFSSGAKINQTTHVRLQHSGTKLTGGDESTSQESLNLSPKKILNATPTPQPELSIHILPKTSNLDDEAATIFLNKIENDDELLIDDVQRLVACDNTEEVEFVNMNSLPVVVLKTQESNEKSVTKIMSKPKLLNKSSVRILNKDADKNIEPRLSLPKVNQNEEGKVEIVAEILDKDEPCEIEPNPADAAPVEIHIFPCPHCERSFPLRQLRDIHVKNHDRERKYTCTECKKSFFSRYDLQKHNLTHVEDKPFKCSACDKSFTRTTLLYRHERTHTDLPKYICVYCERPFLSSEDLDKHIERHTKHRPFKCKLCDKAFAFKQGLERHEVIHSRQQPYPCQYCDQSFSTTSKLARHLTAHAGDRPYPCKFCAKSFLLSHHLTRHMRSHKNASGGHTSIAFNCNICQEIFGSRESLINHSAKHATDDSLLCPLCKECFTNLNEVTSHIKQHSDGEAYACEFCDLIFLSPEKLTSHSQNEHNEEMMAYTENDKGLIKNKKINKQKKQQEKSPKNKPINTSTTEKKQIKLEFIDTAEEKAKDEKIPKIVKQITLTEKSVNINDIDFNDSDDMPIKIRKVESLNASLTNSSPNIKIKTEKTTATPPTSQRKLDRSDEKNTVSRQQSLLKGNNKNSTQLETTINENAIKENEETSSPTSKQTNKVQVSLLQKNQNKTSPATRSNSTTVTTPGTMTIGDSKVKIKKISVTKSEAIALAREGRIRFELGNIILTKPSKKN